MSLLYKFEVCIEPKPVGRIRQVADTLKRIGHKAVRMTQNIENSLHPVSKRKLSVRRLGRIDYETALSIQKETAGAVRDGIEPDTLLLLEHPHTLTIGRRGSVAAVLNSETQLRERGIDVFESNRGGKVTYHGVGQIVGYPIINLSPDREDVHRYVRNLEEALLLTMRDFNIDAFRISGLTGVHTAHGKIAAIGVHIARWITTHGFALNVNTDLSYFDLIIGCEGEPVASMERLLARELEMSEVEDRIAIRFAEVFEMELESNLRTEEPVAL